MSTPSHRRRVIVDRIERHDISYVDDSKTRLARFFLGFPGRVAARSFYTGPAKFTVKGLARMARNGVEYI